MSFLNTLRDRISPHNPFLLFYHKLVSVAAAIWHRFPSQKLRVIAVTGTKGKSTTVHLLASILKAAGYRVGVASSIHFQIGDTVWPNDTKQTTQGRFRLQHLLRQMVRARCDFVVLEVTSHALVQSRLWGVNIDTAVLTNIQRDHIEYHGSFENYLHAKGLLFAHLNRAERKHGIQKTAVLPSDEPHLAYFEAFPVDRKILYGSKGIVSALDTVFRADGSRFTLKVPNAEISIGFPLPGDFNIQNALAASSAALSLGIKLSAIQKGLESATEIPGRLEQVRAGQPFTVIVDYAHTPESLEKVLSLLKPLTRGRLFLVFGATGGGRDKSKRPEMGKIAARYADFIVVTDDDPYTENRMQIIEQVAKGVISERTARARRQASNLALPVASEAELIQKEGENFWMIRDRKEAIRLALSLASEHDTVLIAGKGCEPIQMIGRERIPWDDRKVVREILGRKLEVRL